MMGYGGSNKSAWTDNKQYFGHRERPDSVFGQKVLVLKKVCYMNPFTVIEHIPADWDKIDIAIYHSYLPNFKMKNNVIIKLLSMNQIKRNDLFKQVSSTPWPLPNWQEKPKDLMIREHVTTLDVPANFRQTEYALKLEVFAQGGDWLNGWMFEGIGITRSKSS